MCKPTNTLPTMTQHFEKNLQQLESLLLLQRVSQLSALNVARQIQRSPVVVEMPRTSHRTVFLTERQSFLVFTKVLFKYLSKAKVDPKSAKLVVAKCIRENREGRSVSLVDTLEMELRKCLGETHWHRANKCFHAYCAKLGVKSMDATAIQAV
mmetsp:Transcript_231/g.477  ORF Transcript_231/g.477 Transcript_231/m.477 type:complete len:153 (+) Transcript_231:1250-1708(+)